MQCDSRASTRWPLALVVWSCSRHASLDTLFACNIQGLSPKAWQGRGLKTSSATPGKLQEPAHCVFVFPFSHVIATVILRAYPCDTLSCAAWVEAFLKLPRHYHVLAAYCELCSNQRRDYLLAGSYPVLQTVRLNIFSMRAFRSPLHCVLPLLSLFLLTEAAALNRPLDPPTLFSVEPSSLSDVASNSTYFGAIDETKFRT